MQDAWSRGQPLTLHGWVYRLDNGLIHDLGVSCSSASELADKYQQATAPAAPRK